MRETERGSEREREDVRREKKINDYEKEVLAEY